jgi:hypothetical protein
MIASAGLVLAALACSDNNSNNSGSADDLHQQLEDSFDNVANFTEALQRVLLTLQGTPQPGVNFTETNTGVTGTVDVDVDGNGQRETTVSAVLTYLNPQVGITGGATLHVNSITGGAPQTATVDATVNPTGPTSIQLTNGSGSFLTQTRGNDLTVTSANLAVDGSNGHLVVTGTADFSFNDLVGIATFESDGQGSFRIRVSGDGFATFTVP